MQKPNSQSGIVHWFVIILGILIALVLIGYFTVSKNPAQVSPTANTDQANCGLIIEKPVANSTVTFPVLVSGYLKTCGASPLTSDYGTVQIADSSGVAIGPEVKLSIVGNWVGQPAYFNTVVSTATKPETSSGYLVFTNHDKTGNILKRFNIPVLFSH